MAVIHKSKSSLRRDRRAAGLLMILGWPFAIAAAGLTVWFYIDCGERLLLLAMQWKEAFAAWAAAPREGMTFAQEWQTQLNGVLTAGLHGLAWGIVGLTAALPAVLGLIMTVLFLRLPKAAAKRFRSLGMRLRGEKAALALLRQMPDSCHVFLNKRLTFAGGASEMDALLVGPGGVAVMAVRSQDGLIEGSVTEPVLYRKHADGSVEKLRNPVRQVVGHVNRLTGYLRSQELNVAVLPCVLFAHPEASAYVTVPEELFVSDRRTVVSSCIVTDATSFWELLGRDFAAGRQLPQAAVNRVVQAMLKAPAGKLRK